MSKRTNTGRTVRGFLRSLLARWFPALARSEQLSDIFNYRDLPGLYATSGQPSEAQFQLIHDAGFELVVNLAPTSLLENSVVEEARVLETLGIRYVHIPVDFKNPTEADFQSFQAAIAGGQKTWVHCAANMRVSAFSYRYRTEVLGEDEAQARPDMEAIWEPFGVWAKFVRK